MTEFTAYTDGNVVELAAKRPEPRAGEDYSVECHGAVRMLARLSPEEKVVAFSFSCTEVEARTLARIAARQIGPTILSSIAAGLSEESA